MQGWFVGSRHEVKEEDGGVSITPQDHLRAQGATRGDGQRHKREQLHQHLLQGGRGQAWEHSKRPRGTRDPPLSLLASSNIFHQINRMKSELENHKLDIDNLRAALAQAKATAQTAAINFAEERERYTKWRRGRICGGVRERGRCESLLISSL